MHNAINNIPSYLEVKLQKSAPIAILQHQTPKITKLPIGTKFKATISSFTSSSFIHLESIFGKLSMQTRLSSLKGDVLELQLISKGNQLQFLIMSINGKSPNQVFLKKKQPLIETNFNQKSQKRTAPNINTGFQKNDTFGIKLMAGMETTITVLNTVMLSPTAKNSENNKSAHKHDSSILNQPRLSERNLLNGNSQENKISSQNKNNKDVRLLSRRSMNTLFNNKKPIPILPESNEKDLIPMGTRFLIVIRSVVPSLQLSDSGGLPLKSSLSLSKGVTLTGVVIGKQGSNQSIVQTHAGPLAVNTGSLLPIGTTMDFDIIEQLPAIPELSDDLFKNKFGLIIRETNEWKNLNDAILSIVNTNSTVAQQAINSAIPKLNSTFTSTLLLFLTAIKNSDFASLFGDAPIRILQRTRPDLLIRLREDFQQIAQLSNNSETDDWRTLPIPILNGEKIEQIRLFMRRNNKSMSNKKNSDIRFLIEIKLDKVGKCQLDGLVNKGNKKFDLVVRTELHLSQKIENKIKTIFQQITYISGITGKIDFNFSEKDFVNTNQSKTKRTNRGLFI